MASNKNNSLLFWPLLAWFTFALLVLFGQLLTYFQLEKKLNYRIDVELEQVLSQKMGKADTNILDKNKLAAQYLELQIKDVRGEISDVEKRIKWEYDHFIVIGLPLSLIALFGYFWSVFFYLKKQAEEQVKAELGPIVANRKSDLNKILDAKSEENLLFATKKIKLTTSDQVDKNKMLRLLEIIDFDTNGDRLLTDKDQGDYDVLLINNIGGKLSEDAIIEYALKEENNQRCILYYCESGKQFPKTQDSIKGKTELLARVNFATNPATFYGNLLDTLKLQHKLKEKSITF